VDAGVGAQLRRVEQAQQVERHHVGVDRRAVMPGSHPPQQRREGGRRRHDQRREQGLVERVEHDRIGEHRR
jgi:hypothetical protein